MTATPAKGKANDRRTRRFSGPKESASKAKDNAGAEKWCRKVAERGFAEAQNNLGEIRRQGREVMK